METNTLTASEAAKITAESLEQSLIIQLETIFAGIKKAALNGKYELDWKESLNRDVRNYLQTQGYKLKDWTAYNAEYVTISWRNN